MEVLEVTVPIFLIVAAGYFLRKYGFMGDETGAFLGKLVYYIAFPAMIFKSIASFDFSSTFKIKLVVLNLLVTTIMFAITFFLAFLIKDRRKRGSFNMGAYRSNQGYIGLPVINGFYGPELMSATAIINAFDSFLSTALPIMALEVYRSGERSSNDATKTKLNLKICILKLIEFIINPFVLSALLGLILSYLKIPLLKIGIINEFLNEVGNMALPLALLSIGCSLQVKSIWKSFRLISITAVIKLIIMPVLAFFLAFYIFRIRGSELGMSIVLSAMPSSISNYIMACEMEADAELCAAIIGFTTFASVLTISLIQMIIKYFLL